MGVGRHAYLDTITSLLLLLLLLLLSIRHMTLAVATAYHETFQLSFSFPAKQTCPGTQ